MTTVRYFIEYSPYDRNEWSNYHSGGFHVSERKHVIKRARELAKENLSKSWRVVALKTKQVVIWEET